MLQLQFSNIRLGEIEITSELTKDQINQLKENLNGFGFEILDDQKQKQIEKIGGMLMRKCNQER